MANIGRRTGIDEQMIGSEEPLIGEVITDPNDMKLRHAYNYYNYYHNDKPVGQKSWTPREWVVTYLENQNQSPALIAAFKRVHDNKVTSVWCAIARMHNRGTILPKQTLDRLNKKIIFWVNEPIIYKVVFDDGPKKTVQDHIMANASDMIGEIEETIDQFTNNEISNFSMYGWLTEKGTNNRISKIIGTHFQATHKELVAAYNNDPEAKEGYSHLTRAQLKKHVDFFADIVDDCFKFGENRVTARKPRKKKTKSASVVTQKINYQKEDVNLKLVSIDPSKIVGAQALYTYNTKTSALTALYAEGPNGLTVKGTTVYGFNANTSITKRAGRALNVLPDIVTGGKVTLRRALDGIKAKASEAVGRIGPDTILLRVA